MKSFLTTGLKYRGSIKAYYARHTFNSCPKEYQDKYLSMANR